MPRLYIFVVICLFALTAKAESPPVQLVTNKQLEQGPVTLSGLWAFDWMQLHTNMNFPVSDGLNLPGLWHQQGPYERKGFATFRRVIQLPESQSYYLKVPDLPSAVALWVNGERVFGRGDVGTSAQNEQPKFGPEVIKLPVAHEYQLLMQVSNFHHKEGGMWHNLVLSSQAHLPRLQAQSKSLDAMIFILLIAASIYLLVTSWERWKPSAAILFAVFLWVIALRSVLIGERIAYDFVGDMSWLVQQRFEHSFMLLALPLFMCYFHRFFKLKQLWYAHLSSLLCGLALIATQFLPVEHFAYFGGAFQVLGLVSVGYCLIVLSLLIYKKAPYSRQFMVSFIGLSVLVLHDILYTNLLIQSRPLTQFGLLFFVVMQLHMLWRVRKQESRVLHYVRGAIDQRSDVLKKMFSLDQQQRQQVYEALPSILNSSQSESLSESERVQAIMSELDRASVVHTLLEKTTLKNFVLSLKPYFQSLKCELKTNIMDGNIHLQTDWLQQVILQLARVGERQSVKSSLHLSETQSHFVIHLTIYSAQKYRLLDIPELNLVSQILHRMHTQLKIQHGKRRTEIFVRLPLEGASISSDDSKDTLVSHQVGNANGPVVLIESPKQETYTSILSDHFQLVFAPVSGTQIKRYRPALVILEYSDQIEGQDELLADIKQEQPSLPVLLVIESYHKMQLAQFIRQGVTDYMVAPLVDEEIFLKVQRCLGQTGESLPVAMPQADVRELAVQVVRQCVQYWQSYTGKSKAELAESSRLWRVYMDGSTAKTRTLDKYLSLQSLPKNPRWDTVSRTAAFIKEQCELSDQDKQLLDGALQALNQQLSV